MLSTNVAVLAAAAATGLLAGQASAHLGAGIPGKLTPRLQADAAKRGMQRRQASYNDQSWQSVTTPTTECKYYNYAPASSFSKSFPANWEIADIMPGDKEAQTQWAAVQKAVQIPKTKPKGTPTSSEQGVTYNAQQDPDCWWTESKCVKPKAPGIPADIYNCPESATWGLTFDDGPNCTHNAFYDFLKSKNQKATMFYIGSNVINWPLQAQRGLTDGHQLAAHTWSHRYMTSLNDTQVFAELFYTVKAIKWVTGVTVTSWRPPYGDVDDRVRAIAHGFGLATIIWTDDTDDWEVQPAGSAPSSVIQGNYESIISKAKQPAASGGVVVLTHEINADTMGMMIKEYPSIASAYKYITPVHVCQNQTTPYRETNIVYPTFEQYTGGNVMPSGLPSPNDITAASVASVEVGIVSSSAQASLKASTTASGAAGTTSTEAAAAADDKTAGQSGAAGVHAVAAVGSAAFVAAVGGAAALFI